MGLQLLERVCPEVTATHLSLSAYLSYDFNLSWIGTTAKMVAQRLGFDYIDTGAFYRCVSFIGYAFTFSHSDSQTGNVKWMY